LARSSRRKYESQRIGPRSHFTQILYPDHVVSPTDPAKKGSTK
jgi:hypothetical protein